MRSFSKIELSKSNLSSLKKECLLLANKDKSIILSRFFKTGKGEYAEGDVFLGIMVPQQRKLAKKYASLSFKDLSSLLNSSIHEHRLIALFILIHQYQKSADKDALFAFYLNHLKKINNWDLVDLSAPNIIGKYLLEKKDRFLLYQLAYSENLWERRIAIISTFTFIRHHQYKDTLKISTLLLKDKHDLIHKATGWMLRELGKHDQKQEEIFLKKYYTLMPRTMLRYAIERFPEAKRKRYMKK